MNLVYNEALELIFAMYRFANRYELKTNRSDMKLKPIPELEAWTEKLEKELTPFFINDLELLLSKISLNQWLLILLCIHPEICSDASELLQRLDKLDAKEFRELSLKCLLIENDPDPSTEKILFSLTEVKTDITGNTEREAAMIRSMLGSPGEFLGKMKSVCRIFYETVFKDAAGRIREAAARKQNWHEAEYSSDPGGYLDKATRGIAPNLFDKPENTRIFLSFFLDTEVFISRKLPLIAIGAGTDQIIRQRSYSEQADIFFSTLGDAKRLEIFRLTGKRPWYSNELAEHFGITPATMSYHLNKMVATGLLSVSAGEQNRFYYRVNKKQFSTYLEAVKMNILGQEDGQCTESSSE